MITFGVYRTIQTFADDTPLHGKVSVIVERSTFISAPTHRTMVNDNIFMLLSPQCITAVGFCFCCKVVRSHAETHETDDYVVRLYGYGMSFQANTVTRCTLAGNRYISVGYLQGAFQFYQSAYRKYDRALSRSI